MDMMNIQNPKSAYEQLSQGDKCFLHKVMNKLAIAGKTVTAERLAGIMLNARAELLDEGYQNDSGKFTVHLKTPNSPDSARDAYKLEEKIVELFYIEEGEDVPIVFRR